MTAASGSQGTDTFRRGEMTMTGTQYGNVSEASKSRSRPSARGRKRRTGILLFDTCDLLGANVIAEALDLASRIASPGSSIATYQVTFLSRSGGTIREASSLQVCTEALDRKSPATSTRCSWLHWASSNTLHTGKASPLAVYSP